jgi:DNA mismatch repair protein MutS
LERIEASEAFVEERIAVGITHPWQRGLRPALDACEDRWTTVQKRMETLRQSWNEMLEDGEAVSWTLNNDAPFTFSCTNRRAKILQPMVHTRTGKTLEIIQRGTNTQVILDCDLLQTANTEALAIRSEWKALVQEAWITEWSAWITEHSEVLGQVITCVAELDAECGLATAAELYGYTRPEYVESVEEAVAGFAVTNLRHPILERVHVSTPYVSHSLSFGSLKNTEMCNTDCGLLLYGVNAAGKSSLGKAVGLAILMAQIGMPVPASAMKLIPYTGLYTRILGNDNLWAGMSSFVVEMSEFRSILRGATNRSLVIGDELCAGTETDSAVSIVGAGIQVLAKRGVHFFFATHLHELSEVLTFSVVKPYHLSVRAQGSTLVYDRILKEGAGSAMYGLEVCRGLDMDPEFLLLAFQLRERRTGSVMKASRYNAAVTVSTCSLCGEKEKLETHHIVPQQEFRESKTDVGTSKNRVSNLAVLCAACHDKHHAGSLVVGSWVQTTEGRMLF